MTPDIAQSVGATLALALPFQWYTVAGARTFRRPPWGGVGAVLGQSSFAAGSLIALWSGLFGGLRMDPVVIASLGVMAISVALYEWTRRTVGEQRFFIGLEGEVPEALCESGPYRYMRHPFYLSYVLAHLATAAAIRTPLAVALSAASVLLFVYMAWDDERTLARSRLAEAYGPYRKRVGLLLLFPGRR